MSQIQPKSPFRFDSFVITESHFVREPKEKIGELEVKIEPRAVIDKEKRVFTLVLEVHAYEENGRFDAKVTAIGFFDFKNDISKDHLSSYFYTNAPAILFPYIRAHISTLTALSGMEAVNLPAMKMTAVGEKLKEQTFDQFEEGENNAEKSNEDTTEKT